MTIYLRRGTAQLWWGSREALLCFGGGWLTARGLMLITTATTEVCVNNGVDQISETTTTTNKRDEYGIDTLSAEYRPAKTFYTHYRRVYDIQLPTALLATPRRARNQHPPRLCA